MKRRKEESKKERKVTKNEGKRAEKMFKRKKNVGIINVERMKRKYSRLQVQVAVAT